MTSADVGMDMERVMEQIEGWDAEVERMKARADLILMDLEERYYKVLRDLRLRVHGIKAGLKAIHEAGIAGATVETRLHLLRAVEELRQALEKVPPELVE